MDLNVSEGMRGFESWSNDFLHAGRRLARVPAFTFITVATLALAIGASTAIFCVVDAVLLNPLAYPNAERLVSITATAPGSELRGEVRVGAEFYVAYRDEADKLADLGMYNTVQSTARMNDRVDRLFMVLLTPSVFTTLGAKPLLGRLPTQEEAKKQAPLIVISHWLWQDWFGGDPLAIGNSIELAGTQREVIGVMDRDFRFPDSRRSIWVLWPIADETRIRPGAFNFGLIGRMTPGTRHEKRVVPIHSCAPERFGEFFDNVNGAPTESAGACDRGGRRPGPFHATFARRDLDGREAQSQPKRAGGAG